MIDDDLRAHVEGPMSALFATVHAGRPALVRDLGCAVEDARTLRLSMLSTRASWVLSRLAPDRRAALLFSRPDTMRSVQLKGRVLAIEPATDADRERARRTYDAFTTLVRALDPRGRDFASVRLETDLAVRFAVEQIFDQSPGPGAGALLRAGASIAVGGPAPHPAVGRDGRVAAPVLTRAAAFDGTVPPVLVTVGGDGLPNIINVSKVDVLDDRHVALSRQFFRKTAENLARNPYALIHLMDHGSNRMYSLDVRHLQAMTSGPLFDRLAAELDAIASLMGVVGLFRLEAADVFAIEAQHELPGAVWGA